MFLAWDIPIRLKLFFGGFEGVFMGFGSWEVEMLWVWVMGVTLVVRISRIENYRMIVVCICLADGHLRAFNSIHT
jgi:hypothetical protein